MKGPVKGADMKRAKGPSIPKLFGTDGVRGVANVEPITSEVVLKLGRAAAYVFKTRPGRHRIVIGKDTRLSGYMIESALTAGICSMGVDVLLVGPLPTPAVAFLARSLRADAGVMISASHNPYEDNGIKFFSREGLKLPDEFERQIEDLVISHRIDSLRPTASEIGKAFRIDDAEGRYIEFVKQSLPKRFDLEGMPVVVDCAHGAAYKVAPHIYRELGARVTVIGDHPDGTNINRDCGAVHPRLLQETVKSEGAILGIAHDGDADRAVFVAEDGHVVDGDQILGILALDLKERDRLARKTLVTTTMSNVGLEQSMSRSGIKLVRTSVGDRYILENMLKEDYNFGGEQSGHIIFLDHSTTGDGLISALQLMSVMRRSGKRLSELAACVKLLPQVLINVRVRERKNLEEIPAFQKALRARQNLLNGVGRLLVRYSGTEPVVRIMVEGEDKAMVESIAGELADILRGEIGLGDIAHEIADVLRDDMRKV
jgi:phosphoglucosamine mutase